MLGRLLCKNVLGIFEDWKEIPQIKEVIERMKNLGITENDMNYCYSVILRRYRNCYIAFTNESDFYDLLSEKIEINYPNYFYRDKYYKEMLTATNEEILDKGFTISNFVEHTDEIVDKPLDTVLKQITNQSATKSNKGKIEAYKGMVSGLRARLLDEFLSAFKRMFIRLGSTSTFYG